MSGAGRGPHRSGHIRTIFFGRPGFSPECLIGQIFLWRSGMASAGRPEFKPTAAHRRKVEELVSCGVSQEDCARAIGISKPTLVKHFEEELACGAAKKRAEVIGLLYKSAKKGNVSAQRTLEGMTRAVAAEEAVRSRAGKGQGRPAAPAPKPGKKEMQQAAAEAIAGGSGKFAPPAPPKLVVDNR